MRPRLPSTTYQLFATAMAERKQVVCVYRGKRREVCPVILGYSSAGAEKALTFQFGGESNSILPPDGEWRCLTLASVSEVVLRSGPWHAGSGHSAPQSCVDDVDLDVNSQSPYSPRRQL